jgi:hypothetical protein
MEVEVLTEREERILEIKTRIKEIEVIFSEDSISKNRKAYMADTIPEETIKRRRVLTKELLLLQKEIQELNAGKVRKSDALYQDELYNVLIETLGRDNYSAIKNETLRRVNKKTPAPVKVSFNSRSKYDIDEIKRLRKIAETLQQQILTAREAISKYINDNEPEVNKADFLQKVRSINTCLPSRGEIQKIKI